jgi:HEAT repeat protein
MEWNIELAGLSFTLSRLRSLLQIRSDESRSVLRMLMLALFPAMGGAIGSPGIEALFYARFGVEYLPSMYVALALLTTISTLSLTAALNRVAKSRLFRALPMLMAGLIVAAWLAVKIETPGIYPVLWLGMYLFWSMQSLFTWGIAAMLFDARQAKRLFPIFAASIILGNAIGGLLAGGLAEWLGAPELILAWAFFLLLCFLLARRITRAYDPPEIHFHRPRPALRETLSTGRLTVLGSAYMRWLALAIGLLALLAFMLAFPFSKAAAAEFASENELAGFLGLFQGVTTAGALLLSLFFANRIFLRVGVMGALLIFAAIYLSGFIVLAAWMTFIALLLFRGFQLAWMMGVADTAYQASFNTIPAVRREPARMFIDGIPKQSGIGLAGLLLLFVAPALPVQAQFAGSAVISALAGFALWKARAVYEEALVGALSQGRLQIFQDGRSGPSAEIIDRQLVQVLQDSLRSEQVSIRLLAAEIIQQARIEKLGQDLVPLLGDPNPEIRRVVIRILAEFDAGELTAERWLAALSDSRPEVRLAALEVLPGEVLSREGIADRLRILVDDPDENASAVAAGRLLSTQGSDRAESTLRTLIDSDSSGSKLAGLAGYAAWGGEPAYRAAARLLQDSNPEVRSKAAATIAQVDPERCLTPLIGSLSDPAGVVRREAARALRRIGDRAVPETLAALNDPDAESGALLALERLPLAGQKAQIVDYVQRKVEVAGRLQCYRNVLRDLEGSRGQLLVWSLGRRARESALQAIKAFRLIGQRKAVGMVLEELEKDAPDQQAYAIELLETLDRDHLLSPLLSLWDPESSSEDRVPEANGTEGRARTLKALLDSRDAWLRACAAFSMQEIPMPVFRGRLTSLAERDPDPLVRETAVRALLKEDDMKTLDTLPLMERVLILRDVPLFAKLSPKELQAIATYTGEHFFSDRELIVREGEFGDEMYIIVSGEVQVVKGKDGGIEIARRGPGEYVGEMSLITQDPRMASLIAQGDVRMLCLEREVFERMLLEKPELGLSVMRSLIRRLQQGSS